MSLMKPENYIPIKYFPSLHWNLAPIFAQQIGSIYRLARPAHGRILCKQTHFIVYTVYHLHFNRTGHTIYPLYKPKK